MAYGRGLYEKAYILKNGIIIYYILLLSICEKFIKKFFESTIKIVIKCEN